MAKVHPTAIVHPEAKLHDTVEVGPYTIIGPKVRIGAGTRIGPHAVLEGDTTLGERNRVFQFASVGAIPQDLKYGGGGTPLGVGGDKQISALAPHPPRAPRGGGAAKGGNKKISIAPPHLPPPSRVASCCRQRPP